MGAKDFIWVCWQEPATDCGKTSQIPFSWVTEVLIGDGRAPGSVLKCRWPKTKRQYTAKVIAPPSNVHERSQLNILRIPLTSSSGSGDDDSAPSVAEILAESLRSSDGDGESIKSSKANSVAEVSRKRPESKESFGSASVHSPEALSVDDNEKDADSDADSHDYKPPSLVPETDSFTTRHHQPAAAFNSSPVTSTSFPKELQKWFVLQLSSLKTELLNNFDQVNHKISAMELSIRNIRDRVNRMEGKIDLALLSIAPNGDIGNDDRQPWRREGSGRDASAKKHRDNSDNQPPPLKRQRVEDSDQRSSTCEVRQDDEENGDIQESSNHWPDIAAVSAISVTTTATPKRNARKSIVHRAAPISPPPLLIKQTPSKLIIDRRVHLPPLATKMTPIAAASPSYTPSTSASSGSKAYKRRRSGSPMVAQFKPGSNNQIILLGGNPNYEITRQLYAETLENVYEETPVYLILSLVRRLLCDQDVAKLWFKADQATQPNTYAFRADFAEALKKQGIMQYPRKPLTERDYLLKLNQATYDAKHRVKHGKGSTSRPHSFFPLDKIAVPISPITDSNDNNSKSAAVKTEVRSDTTALDDKPIDSGTDATVSNQDPNDSKPDSSTAIKNDHVPERLTIISVKKENEDDSDVAEEEKDQENNNGDNARTMLAALANL